MNWVLEVLSAVGVPASSAGWLALMMDVFLKGTVILGVAAAIAFGMRGASAAFRHQVWVVALGGLLALPLLSIALPHWQVPFLPSADRLSMLILPGAERLPETPAITISTAVPVIVVQPELPIIMVVPDAASAVLVVPPRPGVPVGSGRPVLPMLPGGSRGAVVRADSLAYVGLPLLLAMPQAEPVTAPRARGSADWPVWILVIWSVGAAFVVSILAMGLLRVWTLARRARPIADAELLGLTEAIADDLEIRRPVRLLESHMAITPMTWGFRNPCVLLPREAANWSLMRRRDVLLHELAHVRRNDYLTQLIARYACAVYWLNPFVWLAARQMRLERERACDDTVLNAGTRPSEYANHLLQIARSLKAARCTAFATVAMARPSQLTGRLLDVLDETRSRRTVSGRASMVSWMVAAAIVLPLACVQPAQSTETPPAGAPVEGPAPVSAAAPPVERFDPADFSGLGSEAHQPALRPGRPLPPRPANARVQALQAQCDSGDDDDRGTNSNSNDDRHTIRWWMGDCSGEVRIEGEVEFNEDFTDIARLSRRGFFSIAIDDGRVIREVEISEHDNRLERRWQVNRHEQQYDAAAAAWLATALEDFFRRSSYQLQERVDWILETRGVQGLLQEAELAYSSFLRARYYEKAIASGQLDVAEVRHVLTQAAREIESDYELSRLLRSVPADYLRDPQVRSTYVQASNSLESDYEKGRVLRAMLLQEGLDDELVLSLLQSARSLESDYELAKLLIAISGQYLHNDRIRATYVGSTNSMDSDYERGRVLRALFEQPNLTNPILLQLLESAGEIDSDYELSRILKATAATYVLDAGLRVPFFDAVNSIDSDYEQRQILQTLLANRELPARVVQDVLASAMTVDSDHELSTILRAIVAQRPLDNTLRPMFFRAVGTLDSDYERRRVLLAAIEPANVDRAVVLYAITVASTLGSDHDKTTVLLELGRRFRSDEVILDALMDAADTIDSDYNHGRVMRVLRGTR
ncbi:MAG: M56 family metallopeptidase [Gemmatimonadetes bacterium]|nr:M56 family metallopeptidase [Gemmatimonadota bacterium]